MIRQAGIHIYWVIELALHLCDFELEFLSSPDFHIRVVENVTLGQAGSQNGSD